MSIRIRRFEEKDIEKKLEWINDPINNQFLHYDLPLEFDGTLLWYHKNKDREDRFDGIIEVNGKVVGLIGLLSIDNKNKKAEYYIVIGENDFKGKKIAKKASKLLLDYGFQELGLNKIYLLTEVENIKAQNLFESLGFVKEGLFKNDIKNRGRLVDRFAYGLLKKNYYKEDKIIGDTMIHKLGIDINNNLYIKRDDLLPMSFGGNKARKAELFFKEIKRTGSNCVVTYGGSSSNHCRVIANKARSNNIPCYIITPQETEKETNNSKLVEILGANLIKAPLEAVKNTIDRTIDYLENKGYKVYFIHGGGHGNTGSQAYVNAYKEIMNYEKVNNIKFDYIFHASGTGTTQAGLMCGKILNNSKTKIIGISIARENPYGGKMVWQSVNSYMKSIGKEEIGLEEVNFIDDYILEGYGSFNNDILTTIKRILEKEEIALDATYTGKAFWGMKEYISKYQIANKNILFIHTGGTPLFFDDLDDLKEAINYEI